MLKDVLFGASTALPNFRGHVRRPRIDELLADMMERYLLVVQAGAGGGKTHAVSAYLHGAKARVLWLQLSELDNNPATFWRKFLYAMEMQSRESAAQLCTLGFPDTHIKYDKFLRILAREIYSGEQAVIVLDDFHLLNDEPIMGFMRHLFQAKMENLCIVVNTRTNPDFGLATMVSNELAGHITAQDLNFTLEETEEYLRHQGLSLSAREAKKVHAHTEGWPLALYLVGLSIKKGGGVSEEALRGAAPMIDQMIEDELFSQYAPQTQNFLLRASLLSSFPCGLLGMLSGGLEDEALACIQHNMFLYANPSTGQYDFHHFFLEFLRARQGSLSHREIQETYVTAAQWCAANDLKMEALTYYDKCGRHDEILKIVLNFGVAIFSKSVAEFYIGLIDRLPSELVQQNPLLHVHRAGLLCNNAQPRQAIQELLEAQKELQSRPPTQDINGVLGEICCMLGLIYLGMADYNFADQFTKAREYLPQGSAMINSSGMAVNTRYAIMLGSPAPGELHRMQEVLFFAMPHASQVMHGYGQGLEHLASAEAAYFTGDMKSAEKKAYAAVYAAREKQVADVACSGFFLLMRVEAARGNYQGVAGYLRRLKAYAEDLGAKGSFYGMPDVAQGWFSLLFGDGEDIPLWLVEDDLDGSVLAPYSMGMERSLKAKHLLKSGRYYELLAWLAQSEKPLRQYSMWLGLLDLLIGKAIALHHIHEEAQALDALREAWEIAHGNGLITQFAEYGNHVRPVIYSAKLSETNAIPGAWLEEIYNKSATYEKHLRTMRAQHRQLHGQSAAPAIKLTQREKEMLAHVCQGLTNAEIAGACFVTISAVKKTLVNIYIKLGAANRADAVRIALQLKLNA